MYTRNCEQAVKMRDLAVCLRRNAGTTSDTWYRCQFELAALDLEAEAERLERAAWQQAPRLIAH